MSVFFSAPEPKAQVHYCNQALSVVRLSVVVNFSHFRLLLWNRWREFDVTLQEARSQRPLPSLCLLGPIKKTRWPPWPQIAETFYDFSSETTERNSMKLDRKQDLNVLYQVFFRANWKNKMATLASDWLRYFRLLLWNRWTEFNKTWKEARSLCPLPSLCFRADRKNKMAALASDWLRHFRFLLWNHWTEFKETWQEARSQCPLPSLCFSGWSENKMALWASFFWVHGEWIWARDKQIGWTAKGILGELFVVLWFFTHEPRKKDSFLIFTMLPSKTLSKICREKL